jgi:hypothetical protein
MGQNQLMYNAVSIKTNSNLMKQKGYGFEVLTAVSTKMAVFWVVAPCSLVEVYQCSDDRGSKDL